MRALIFVLLVAALTWGGLGEDIDCDEVLSCGPDDPEACVFHSELYCFTTFENICAWQTYKCKHHLNFQLYDAKYCELENFQCRRQNNEDNE